MSIMFGNSYYLRVSQEKRFSNSLLMRAVEVSLQLCYSEANIVSHCKLYILSDWLEMDH